MIEPVHIIIAQMKAIKVIILFVFYITQDSYSSQDPNKTVTRAKIHENRGKANFSSPTYSFQLFFEEKKSCLILFINNTLDVSLSS